LRTWFVSIVLLFSASHPGRAQSPEPFILRFGGDLLLAAHYENAVGDNPDSAFAGFDLFNSADLSVVNLECPITTRGEKVKKPFNFRMNPRFLGAVENAGIDVACLANNHIFDYGRQGLFDTFSYLDSAGIWHIGAGRNEEEAMTPLVVQAGNRRIALQAYYGASEAPAAKGQEPGVTPRRLPVILADIAAFRNRDSADYVIIVLHWGTEKATVPDDDQIEFAHALIDGGADAVVGHHPHVLQGIERYRNGVIVYSLGNLVFGGNSRDSYDSGLFEIALGDRSARYRFIPIRMEGWKLVTLTGMRAGAVVRHMVELSSHFPRSIFTIKETR